MAYKVEVPWRKLGYAEKRMGKELKKQLAKAMKTAGKQSEAVLVGRTMTAPPASESGRSKAGAIAFGKLVKGWNIDVSEKDLISVIYNTEDYAQFVEEGVKARPMGVLGRAARAVQRFIKLRGRQPKGAGSVITNLELWVNVKLGLSGPPARRMAKRIWFAMRKRNMKGMMLLPRKIIGRSMDRIREIHQKRLAEALYKAAKDGVDSAR